VARGASLAGERLGRTYVGYGAPWACSGGAHNSTKPVLRFGCTACYGYAAYGRSLGMAESEKF